MRDRTEYQKKYYETHKEEIALKQDERHKLLDSKKPHKMLQHHVKYEEIHGVDEIVLLTYREHKKLHNRLRREGKCNIPAEELDKIVCKAASRSPNKKEHNKMYHSSDKAKEYNSNYHKENEQIIGFHETLAPYIQLFENLVYNKITGNVRWVSYFVIDKRPPLTSSPGWNRDKNESQQALLPEQLASAQNLEAIEGSEDSKG